MKWIPNKTFPYPVLATVAAPSDRDYVNREFQVTPDLEINPDSQTARIKMSCKLSEESLLALIARGAAKYATEIHCRETFLRRLLTSDKPDYSADFAKGELHQRVEVSSYVVCTESVNAHTSRNFHEEFGVDAKFDFKCGDVLATEYPSMYWVDPNPAQAIGSIFELKAINKDKEIFSVDLDNENIQIVMHMEDAMVFKTLQHNRKRWPSLLASVYLSTLCEVLRAMTDKGADSYRDRKWFGVVAQALGNKNIQLTPGLDILRTAQILLHNPAHVMMADSEGKS